MVFNSLTFLIFFAIVLLVDRLLRSWTARKWHLVLASYLFYAAWNPALLLLLLLSTTVDWYAAKGMYNARTPVSRRWWLVATLTTNLGLLAFFKYAGFLMDTAAFLLSLVGLDWQPPVYDIVLPPGISFYTFMTLSYTIDVYRKEVKPWSSALDFMLLVSFFPHLVAGPILRAHKFHPQLLQERRATRDQIGWGFTLLLFGLILKLVLADGLFAPVVDQVFGKALRAGGLEAWIGSLAFAGQVFCDFAGYSTCAIGTALCLGFILPENFRCPYASIGFSELWRRWHISLSQWLRDYLYIPLGGNQKGERRTYVNLMLTMLLGGLWHGSTWMFVIWGGLQGLYLTGERWLRARFPDLRWTGTALGKAALVLLTFALTCLGYVFFRAGDIGSAWHLVSSMLVGGASGGILDASDYVVVGGLVAGMLIVQWRMRDTPLEALWARSPVAVRIGVLTVMLVLLCLSGSDNRAFIYFQF